MFLGNQKRIHFDGAVYFVTTNTSDRVPFFREKVFCEIFVDVLRMCKILYDFDVFAFVIMHDHAYLLFMPHQSEQLGKIIQSLKRHISRDINFVLGFSQEGAISESLFQGDVRSETKLMAIRAHRDRVRELKRVFQQEVSDVDDFPKFKWQKSYHDHYIRNERDFDKHKSYIYMNPQKHGVADAEEYTYVYTNYPDIIDA